MFLLHVTQLRPGRTVWLENNGLAFKVLRLNRVTVLAVTEKHIYFFPFLRLPLTTYNRDLTWRCWDGEPDVDTLCETEWEAA